MRFGRGTDLFYCFCPDRVPNFFGDHAEEFLVYLHDVETLSSRQVVMPLSSNSGMVYNENLLTIGASTHWIKLEVEIKVGEGLDVFLRPAANFHVLY